jgi:hypothetical protein
MRLLKAISRDAAPFVIRLPRFILKHRIGAGDAVAGITAAVGIPPCRPCAERAEKMNQWAELAPRSGRSG